MKVLLNKLTFALPIATMLLGIASNASDIPPALLNDLRNATVLVRVSDDRSGSSGSGFLIRSDAKGGFIITNQHVVGTDASSRIQVVFRSGAVDETVVAARVLASDKETDLALLRVETTRLPKPYVFADSAAITETMRTFVLGFPFGSDLDSRRQNPAITISQASVSSLRKNQNQQVELIQLDGTLNPGNSGGPVVDGTGRLIGVAVARIQNAGIGFAVPVSTVTSFLAGDITGVVVNGGERPSVIKVVASLSDPFERIRELSGVISIAPGREIPFRFNRDGQSASATVILPASVNEVLLVTRARFADGKIMQKPAMRVPVQNGKVAEVESKMNGPAQARGVIGATTARAVQFGGKVVSIVSSPDGKGAFVIREGATMNELLFWKSADNSLSARIQVPLSPKHLATAGPQVLVLCPESEVIAVIDPATMRSVDTVPIGKTGDAGQPVSICPSDKPDRAYVLCGPDGGISRRGSAVVIEVDLKSRNSRQVFKGDTQRAVALENHLLCQSNFGGSPSGIPTLRKLSDGKPGDEIPSGVPRFDHRTYGPIQTSLNGHFLSSDQEDKTTAFSPADNKKTWTVDGTLIARWPDRTRFLLTKGDDLTNPEALPLIAVDQTGQTLWKANAAVGVPVSMLLTKSIFVHDMPKKLMVGTAHHGDVFSVSGY